jgi:hypothetical protein
LGKLSNLHDHNEAEKREGDEGAKYAGNDGCYSGNAYFPQSRNHRRKCEGEQQRDCDRHEDFPSKIEGGHNYDRSCDRGQ